MLQTKTTNTSKEEKSLIEGLSNNERSSQTAFYKKYFGLMFSIALRYSSTREDAHEIINMAFLKTFKSINSYSGSGSFEGWIRTIVKRTAIDYCRKFKYNTTQTHEILEIDATVYNEAINNLQAEDFLQIIALVPQASRTVFNLFAIEGYSHKEISDKLNISVGTSKWHLSNARKLLIDLIKSGDYGYE